MRNKYNLWEKEKENWNENKMHYYNIFLLYMHNCR